MHVLIKSERLYLREFSLKDAPNLLRLHSNEEVQKYTGEKTIHSIDHIKKYMRDRTLYDYKTYGYGRWAVFLNTTNEFIGWAGLKYLPEFNKIDLGYRFFPDYWGQGYGTEASKAIIKYGFNELNLVSIIAVAMPENIGSIKIMQKVGMTFDKKAPYEDGEPDAMWYSICKTENEI